MRRPWHSKWWGRSRRARVGGVLLAGTLVVVGVALPVWAFAAADLNAVAGWANILALPVTALGLVLVLVDHDRASEGQGAADRQVRPWMAPPLDRMVERPELGGRLMAVLAEPTPAMVGLTTGLQGAGGFGKTRLAAWLCHQSEISRRFPGGLLWVTVGQEVHGADLAERINDLSFTLGGRRPAISDPDAAGAELGRLLEHREPVLLVIDDVWEPGQLRPFRFGAPRCTRLVTTRVRELLPEGAPGVLVDAMTHEQARALVADGVTGLPADAADRLAKLAGRWPVLLNLVNGALRRRVAWGQAPDSAAARIADELATDGPAAFDPARAADRGRAVVATVEASLGLLDQVERERYLDLAIFPEDVEVPLALLWLLWPGCRVDALCEELVGLGLVADYRLDPPGPRLVVHDVMRAYLHTRRGRTERADAHRRLVGAAAGMVPGPVQTPVPWWLLPADATYLWRYLPYHLHHAGRDDELAALVSELRWVEAKISRFGSVVTVEADLELVSTSLGAVLRRALAQSAHLLGPIDPSAALGATLASRLHGVPELREALDRYRTSLPRPLLEPVWPLPDLPDSGRPVLAAGHTAVISCAFSPDGALLATGEDDGTARLWRVADHGVRAVLSGHSGGVWGCAFSPDGTLLATASDDRTVRLWRLADQETEAVLSGHTDWVTDCAFSPDGTLLATTSQDETVRLWNIADRAGVVLSGHTGGVWGCAFSPDGTLLATASHDETVRIWRVADHGQERVLSGHVGAARGCAFSPDGSLLATTSDEGTVRLWRMPDCAPHAVLVGPAAQAWACAFSPSGGLLAVNSPTNGVVRLWRVDTGERFTELTGHTGPARGCAFSPDGTLLATTGHDQVTRLWQVPGGTQQAVLGHLNRVYRCAFSPQGTVLAMTHEDGTTHLRRMPDGARHTVLAGHSGRVKSCAFSPDGTLVATTGNDHTARLWLVANGDARAVLTGHTEWVTGCAFSPDGELLATTSNDRTARLWRVADGTARAVMHGHAAAVDSCEFSPDGELLATTGNDRTVRLWHVASGTERIVLTGHTDVINGCAFSPNGELLATTSDDRTARLWRVADGVEWAVLAGHRSWVENCAFSPDGALLATVGRDGTVRVWHVATKRCHCALRIGPSLTGVTWHPDGTTICVTGGPGVYLLNYQPQ